MSVSLVLNRWLNRVYKSAAILLVLFAVVLSAFRLFLPYAHHYKASLESYINDTYQANISIETISMGWQKFGPTLVANNVVLLDTQSTKLTIRKLDIRVNFWESIASQKLVAQHLTLDGFDVALDQTQTTKQAALRDNEQALIDNINDLFLTQLERFSLRNSEVVIQTEHSTKQLKINQLNWLNEGDRHRANGDVIIGGVSSNHLKLLLDLKGQKEQELQGQIYLQANELNVTPWLDRVLAVDNDQTQSSLNFDAWLNIDQGRGSSLLVQLRDNEISWHEAETKQQIALSNGQLYFQKTPTGFQLNSSELTLVQNQQQWAPFDVAVVRDDKDFYAQVSSLDIAGLSKVFPLLSDDDGIEQTLDQLAPMGELSNLTFQYANQQFALTTDFSIDKLNYSGGIPGLNNLSGDMVYANNQVHANIQLVDGALDFNDTFRAPIVYDAINATFDGEFADALTHLNFSEVEITSPELTMQADVQVSIPKEADVTLALLASIQNVDAQNVPNYYPHHSMGQDLVDYLNGSILSGKVAQANVLLNGPLSKFPFNHHEGIFVVDGELAQSKFQFDDEWPAIENFTANLNFTNNSMLITAREGTLSGLDVVGVEAEIEELVGSNILTVDVNVKQGAPEHATALMLASPLADSVGLTLEQIVIEQPIDVDFHLHLPLQNTDDVVASGTVFFDENDIELQSPAMSFSSVSGSLRFENEVLVSEDLAILWRGMPLTLNVNSAQYAQNYKTHIDLVANWAEQEWQQQVPEKLLAYASNSLSWQGELVLNNHNDGGFSYDLAITSDLVDTQLDVPLPYRLAVGETSKVDIKVNGHGKQSTITAAIGNELSFYGVLNHESIQFTRSHLVLGDEQMLLPMDGFHITTKLDYAELTDWQPFIGDILSAIEDEKTDYVAPAVVLSPSTVGINSLNGLAANATTVTNHQQPELPLFPVPERIRGTINQFNVLGQPLSNVSFNLLDKEAWWLLQLNAKEARSEIKFFPNWLEQGIEVNADFLHFRQDEKVEQELAEAGQTTEGELSEIIATTSTEDGARAFDNALIFAHVPPVSFHCDSCKIGQLDLGEVDFNVVRKDDATIVLQQFRAQRDKSELTFDLTWHHNAENSYTVLTGKTEVNDVEREIEKFDYASIIKESGGTGSFNMQWAGGPHDFDITNVDGTISAKLDDGYLADVGDSARIFSVLSLQSLLRKLTLDFRDIFADGMFYSSISGDFRFKDGILYTENTQMKGAAGNMNMQGNTELTEGILDYKLSYKPNLTSSLPVLAWIATLQPTIFLAGIAIDQVITSKVVSEFNFELTGSLDEPDMREVDRVTKDISVGRSSPPQVVEQEGVPKEVENQSMPLDPSMTNGEFKPLADPEPDKKGEIRA